jgi:hypothetical protein
MLPNELQPDAPLVDMVVCVTLQVQQPGFVGFFIVVRREARKTWNILARYVIADNTLMGVLAAVLARTANTANTELILF